MTSLHNPDYLKHLCQKYGLVPSRKYGQNFLVNDEPIIKMLEVAEIKKDDTVIEIGPGFGILTFGLAEKAKKVLAFEIEKKLTAYWEEQMQKTKNIEIVWDNVLNQNINLEKYKIIANLPYQITSNFIRKFLEAKNKPEIMVLMVQKEVAERICAKPGDMSILSVSVQYYAEPEIVCFVPKLDFWPVPAVNSAVIKIKNIKPDIAGEDFFKIIKAGFANRRKMLVKNLSSVADKNKLAMIFQELGLNEKVRAQELSVEQWKKLVYKVAR